MLKVKYCILGAGPAGLTFANRLKQYGEEDFIVLERENEAGGLCRSTNVDGAPLDIGGGHFLDVRRPRVCEFIFSFMPREEWNLYERDSRIQLENDLVGHPLEANIWQMTQKKQMEYLKSIAIAGCNLGIEKPENFIDWIYWKFGNQIADDYMLPYNRKMFGSSLDELGTYWLEKLPNVSFEETLLSCLNKKAYGTQPGHAQFYYPKKYGYGEVWLRMAKAIDDKIYYSQKVTKIDIENKIVSTTEQLNIQSDFIISTIPWTSFLLEGISKDSDIERKLLLEIKELKHTGVEIAYFHENQKSDAQWIYIPDKNVSYHRILSRKTFCPNSRGYWTETNLDRVEDKDKEYAYCNEYAYPLNTINKPEIVKNLLNYMTKKQIIGLGRWGEHEHYNSDVVVERALNLAENLCGNKV